MKPTPSHTAPAAPRFLRWFWVLGVVLLAASLLGARFFFNGGSSKGSGQVESTVPGREISFGYVDTPNGVMNLAFPFAGRVTKVLVSEGETPVKKGDALVELDADNARQQLKAAEADLQAAELAVKIAKEQADQYPSLVEQQDYAVKATGDKVNAAKHRLKRLKEAVTGKFENPAEADAVQNEIDGMEKLVKIQEAKLKSMKDINPHLPVQRAEMDVAAKRAQRDRATKLVDEHTLKAPVDGTVLRVLVSAGDMYSPEMKVPVVFFCPSGPRIIRAEVDQEFASRVKSGQRVCIQDDSNGQGRWTGKVSRVSDWFTTRRAVLPEPLQFHDVRTLECIVDDIKSAEGCEATNMPLRINQRMRVTIYPDAIPEGECSCSK